MQRRVLLLVLMMVMLAFPLLGACQSENTLPNSIESTDVVGTIEVRYPRGWISVPGDGIIDGRLAITLIQADRDPEGDLSQVPVLRIVYDERAKTILALNTPLSEYAVKLVSETIPGTAFDAPLALQVANRPAVMLKGSNTQGSSYQVTVVDFADKNAVILMELVQPSPITSAEQQLITRIAETIAITIQPLTPTTTLTLQPEATAESTAETAPESTEETTAAPESTEDITPDSAQPESTEEITPQPNSQPSTEAPATPGDGTDTGSEDSVDIPAVTRMPSGEATLSLSEANGTATAAATAAAGVTPTGS